MLKYGLAVASILGAASIARADSIGPSPPADPQPSAPGTGAYQKGTLGLSLPVTLISNLGSVVSFGEPVGSVNLYKFLSDKAAFDLIFGVNLHKQQIAVGTPPVAEDTTVFGLVLGAGYRIYTHKDKLHRFVEPQLIFNWPDVGNTPSLAIQVGGLFGAEREIVDSVAVAGAIGVFANFANEFKDIQLATQATLSVNIYWK